MIHTMLISTSVPLEVLEEIADMLKLNTEEKRRKTTFYSKEGFREITLLKLPIRAAMYYAVEIRLNPKVMLENKEDLNVIGVADISRLADVFNHKLGVILGYKLMQKLPQFNDWICKRIDYAVDIRTDNVEEYIKLFQRVATPNIHFEAANKRTGSAYATSKSITLSFYDKEDEVSKNLENEYSSITESDIKEIENVLRFEIQCKKPKTNYIKSKKDLPNNTIINFLDLDIARDTILNYYDLTIGAGDFYSLNEAKKMIKNQKNLSQRTKNSLINTLILIAQARNVNEAKKQFAEGVKLKNTDIWVKGTVRTFNKHIKQLREIGINPVTIPRNWGVVRLRNLREFILELYL